ncbi:MAG TPA: methyltransferase domain-containing protein [Alphaproteobacteria bacterium]|nr:methyltransferase domain-containing protein [Alphaproteobacteria bacterium]
MKLSDRTHWDARYTQNPESWTEPDDFLVSAYDEFLAKLTPGRALDLAGGAGRNAVFLAQRGWQVKLVDISEVGLGLAREKASSIDRDAQAPSHAKINSLLTTEIVDLHATTDLGTSQYDLITVFYFLRRELFPALVRALKPGGWLIYRTYTIDRLNVPGGPRDPKFLLQPKELLNVFASLKILRYRETQEGKAAAELVGQKP